MVTSSDFLLAGCIYAAFNAGAFFVFAHDKSKAERGRWRTPETMLLLVAFIGPFGAYAAMRVFRHKTRKLKFYLVPVFMALHVIGILILTGAMVTPGLLKAVTGISFA